MMCMKHETVCVAKYYTTLFFVDHLKTEYVSS